MLKCLGFVPPVKLCNTMKSPKNGNISCFNEDGEKIEMTKNTTFPIDTHCKFACSEGFTHIGSKNRYCLPIARWDGLNTYCRGKIP